MQALEQELLVLLLPKDPLDEKNIMLEIRAGTGGDEASIWAGDLLRMYQKYCAVMGWKSGIINWSAGDSGGYKDATLEIKGDSVYSRLKYEAGAPRSHGAVPAAAERDEFGAFLSTPLFCGSTFEAAQHTRTTGAAHRAYSWRSKHGLLACGWLM